MAINTDIYGTQSNWTLFGSSNDSNPNKRVYRTSNYIGSMETTPIGSPIDKSPACSGLGTESCFSHLKFYETSALSQAGAEASSQGTPLLVEPSIIENREVTNWCFSTSRTGYAASDYNQRFSLVFDTNYGRDPGGTAANPANGKWSPLPANNSSDNASNISPVTQFNHSNLVGAILVAVKSEKTPSRNNMQWFYLDDYISSHTEEFPYIYTVCIRLYISINGSGTLTALNPPSGMTNISILDNIQLPITNPYMYSLVGYTSAEIKIMGSICMPFNIDTRGVNTSDIKSYIGACVPDTWEVAVTWGSTYDLRSAGYICRTYDETFHDEVFEQVACLGILFTGKDPNNIYNFSPIHEDIYCGVLDEHLIGHGEWTKGIKNATNEQLAWTNTNDSTYDPSYIPDPSGDEPYDANVELLHTGNLVQAGNWYVDTIMGEYVTLVNWCSSINLDTVSKNEYFFGQNPIDCIVTARLIFTDYDLGVTAASEKSAIIVGSYPVDPQDNTRAKAYEVSQYSPETVNCGSSSIGGYYHDFRDLSPYSSLTLLLPFAGAVDLPTDVFMNHSCTLFETVDPISGDLKYNIYCDSALYTTVTGNCGVDLSIVGLETATYRLEKYRLQSQAISQGFNAAASLTGGVSGALIAANYGNIEGALSQLFGGAVNATNSLVQSFRTEKQMSRTLPAPAILQKASGDVECGCGFEPVILHTYPRMLAGFETSLEPYRQRVGFATYTVGKIKDQKYVVVCENVVLSGFSCTKEEMTMIKQLLESGIYIK